jgi:beta-glucosidase-like glycosyl hydrolase
MNIIIIMTVVCSKNCCQQGYYRHTEKGVANEWIVLDIMRTDDNFRDVIFTDAHSTAGIRYSYTFVSTDMVITQGL